MFIVKSIRVQIDPRNVDRTAIHQAMATRYREIVRGNFGYTGIDRPTPWKQLSGRYRNWLANTGRAGRVDIARGIATLIRSGRLFGSISAKWDSNKGTVGSYNVPYANIQQFGGVSRTSFDGKPITIPPRPFFPFFASGNPTSYAQSEMTRVAIKAAKFK